MNTPAVGEFVTLIVFTGRVLTTSIGRVVATVYVPHNYFHSRCIAPMRCHRDRACVGHERAHSTEGRDWIRGAHAVDSVQARAMLAALLLVDT